MTAADGSDAPAPGRPEDDSRPVHERRADGRDDAPRRAPEARVVAALGRRWYLEVRGAGPVVALVHGTGASTGSWREVAPRLAEHCTVVAVDLPGHGRTEGPADRRLALAPMADDVAAVLRREGLSPSVVVGHSAGVAVALEIALRRPGIVRAVAGFGAALVPPPWVYDTTFAPVVNRVVTTRAFARVAAFVAGRRAVVDSLLKSTGSTLPAESVAEYRARAGSPSHVRATLVMMAQWDLRGLAARLPEVALPVDLATGERDAWTPASALRSIVASMPDATLTVVPGAGHVLHEEMPAFAAEFVLATARRAGVLTLPTDAGAPVGV